MTKGDSTEACSLLHLLAKIIIAMSYSQNASSQTYDPEWFGSNCQYKCRCGGMTCGQGGVCPGGVFRCGCFGPGFQFVDFVYTKRTLTTFGWLNDGTGAV
jgi:hypothetical protein